MYIQCPDMSENKNISIYTNFNDTSYKFQFKWNNYCDYCFLDIYDENGDAISTGNGLVGNTVILTDTRKIPILYFLNINGEEKIPTLETMKDFCIYYADTD